MSLDGAGDVLTGEHLDSSPSRETQDIDSPPDCSDSGGDDHLQGFRPLQEVRFVAESFSARSGVRGTGTGMSAETQRINANFFALADKVESLESNLSKLVQHLSTPGRRVSRKRNYTTSDDNMSDDADFTDSDSDEGTPEFEEGNGASTQAERALHRATRLLNNEKRRKSGLQLGAEINVRKRIQWPHQFILRNSAPVRFETISIAELISGLMEMTDSARRRGGQLRRGQ